LKEFYPDYNEEDLVKAVAMYTRTSEQELVMN
jgi:hypothetical protein